MDICGIKLQLSVNGGSIGLKKKKKEKKANSLKSGAPQHSVGSPTRNVLRREHIPKQPRRRRSKSGLFHRWSWPSQLRLGT